MYKIASIEKVLSVRDHPNGENLSLVEILGWQVVAKRNEFKAGDLVVYIEVDSVLEDRPLYQFLKGKQFRVKLVRLRGQLSQGILFPLSAFTWPEPIDESWIGRSVADMVGARHYEKPVPGAAMAGIKGDFPGFLRKTDELNIRSYVEVIDQLKGKECYISLKLDGTSITYYHMNGEFGVCSRNYELKVDDSSAAVRLAEQYNLQAKLAAIGKNIALQGELYGPGIQSNRMAIKAIDYAIFNLYLIDERRFANYEELSSFCLEHNLSMVPTLWRGRFDFTLEQLITMANDQKYPGGGPAEGIVLRPIIEEYSPILEGRTSVKIVSERFLEEFGE